MENANLSNHSVAQELNKLSQEEQDLILAYLFLNYSELERYSGIPRIRWKAKMDDIRNKLQDLVCFRAGKVSTELTRVYSELVKDIENSQGLGRVEHSRDNDKEIRISHFHQRPQTSTQELAIALECYNPPGRGALYETYTEEGVRVRIKALPCEIRIHLDPEKMSDVEVPKYNLAFDYKSSEIDDLDIKLYGFVPSGNMTLFATYRYENLNKGFWKEVVVAPLPKDLVQIVIVPKQEGIFHITRMRLILPTK